MPRFADWIRKFLIILIISTTVVACLLLSLLHFTETTDRRVMFKLLNYNRETIIEKEKYFKLESVPEFKIYPLNENEFRVVFVNGVEK